MKESKDWREIICNYKLNCEKNCDLIDLISEDLYSVVLRREIDSRKFQSWQPKKL